MINRAWFCKCATSNRLFSLSIRKPEGEILIDDFQPLKFPSKEDNKIMEDHYNIGYFDLNQLIELRDNINNLIYNKE